MFERLKEQWQELKEGDPGKRFQEHYCRRQEGGRSRLRKPLFIGAGVLIIAAGIFFLPAPGPGSLILIIGVALIAQESRLAARALDWTEVKVRPVAEWGIRTWKHASPAVKALIILLAAVAAAAAGWAAYVLFFRT